MSLLQVQRTRRNVSGGGMAGSIGQMMPPGSFIKYYFDISVFQLQSDLYYNYSKIIRDSWAYQILAEKSAYNRGQRIIEVSYISLEQV